MKKFFVRLTLFALPFAVYLIGTGSIAFYTGEAFSYQQVLRMQAENPDLVYSAYDQDATFSYKITYLQNYAPELVILGSSRSLQYRSIFFNRNPEAVYNAGGHTWNLRHMLSMTQYFDADAMPSVIIIVLEQPDFRPQDSFEYNPILLDVTTLGQNRDVIGIANVTRALLGERMTFSQIMQPSPDHLGLAAISFNYGFRFDGSFELSQEFLDAIEERRNSHWQAFQERSASYFFEGTGISSQNLSHLENLLQWASDQGIYVIGYYPPFSQTIYDAMMEAGEYTYIPDSAIALNDLFNRYEFSFFDFTNPSSLGTSDAEMYDGIHSGEWLQLLIHREMVLALPDVLGDYADVATLDTWLAQTDDPFHVNTSP